MATFVVYNKLTKKEAQFAYDGITKWFKKNPDRTDCKTETFTVRRDHIKEDILKHSEDGVVLKEPGAKKKPAAKKTVKKTAKKPAKKTTKKSPKTTMKLEKNGKVVVKSGKKVIGRQG